MLTVEYYLKRRIEVDIDPDPICWPRESPQEDATIRVKPNRYFNPDCYPAFDPDNDPDFPVKLPLYMYAHSGVTLRTFPFDDQWDSCQIGYVYATDEDIANCLVRDWDSYLNETQYWVCVLDADGNKVWSLAGLYCIEDAITEAKAYIEAVAKQES